MAEISLKPESRLTIALATGAVIYGVFQTQLPTVADVRANEKSAHVESARKVATWESLGIVAGISLLAKSPEVFIIGGAITAVMSWTHRHAGLVHPATGKVPAPVPGPSADQTGNANDAVSG